MLLSPLELQIVKPLLSLVDRAPYISATLTLATPEGCAMTLELSANGLLLRKTCTDSPPTTELYRTVMGLAQAYRVPLALVSPTEED